MNNILQDLQTLRLNPYAAQLLAESLLKSPLAPMTVGQPQRFFFPVQRSDCAGWSGVRFSVEAVRADGDPTPQATADLTKAAPWAWAHPDGRVVQATAMETARRCGGASATAVAGFTVPLVPVAPLAAEWRVVRYGSPDLQGYNVYAYSPGATHGDHVANLGDGPAAAAAADALCAAHNAATAAQPKPAPTQPRQADPAAPMFSKADAIAWGERHDLGLGFHNGLWEAFEDAATLFHERLTPPQPAAPKGFALVPKRMTQAMRDVTDAEGWTWEDLLAAAEAITEDEHAALAADTPAPQTLTEERIDALLDSPAPFDFVLALHLDGKRGLMHRFARAVIAEFCRINGIDATAEKGGTSC